PAPGSRPRTSRLCARDDLHRPDRAHVRNDRASPQHATPSGGIRSRPAVTRRGRGRADRGPGRVRPRGRAAAAVAIGARRFALRRISVKFAPPRWSSLPLAGAGVILLLASSATPARGQEPRAAATEHKEGEEVEHRNEVALVIAGTAEHEG